MKLPQAARHTRQQFDRFNSRVDRPVHIKEIERLSTDSLQPPKRLAPKDAVDAAHQWMPRLGVMSKYGERIAVAMSRLLNIPDYCRLPVRVLPENHGALGAGGRNVRDNVAAVILNELFGNQSCRHHQGRARIIANLNGKVRQGQQKGIFVCGGELSLGENALDLRQECDLFFSARRHWPSLLTLEIRPGTGVAGPKVRMT
jgi:hypothetical protein